MEVKEDMSYTPKTWENKPSTASPINATNLNHMEGGIKTNDDNIIGAQNAILTLQGEMLQAQGDISALETLVDSMLPVDSESGNPAVITDAFGGACKSLNLTLEPIQSGSGTPSPQNVRPISGRTQSVVTRCGKNIAKSTYTQAITTRYDICLYVDAPLEPDKTYTFSFTSNSGNQYYTPDDIFTQTTIASASGNKFTLTVTTKSTLDVSNYTEGRGWIILKNYVAQANTPTFSNVQCEIGSTATTYEPYTSASITRTYGTTIYGGSDDVTGEGATSKYGLAEFDGSADENWQTGLASNCFSIVRGEVPADLAPSNYITSSFEPSNSAVTGKMYVGTNYINVCYTAVIDNVTDWRTYLSSHPLQICYKLTTPTSIPLTSQNITLLHGDNVLTTDADSIEASYSADIALYIAKKISEGSNNNRSVDNSSLSKGGSGDEESKEEVKEEVKEEEKEEIEIKEAEPLTKEVR